MSQSRYLSYRDEHSHSTALICSYLDNAAYPEPFESAHSAILAIFSAGKACVSELTPWYTQLLLSVSVMLRYAPVRRRVSEH